MKRTERRDAIDAVMLLAQPGPAIRERHDLIDRKAASFGGDQVTDLQFAG